MTMSRHFYPLLAAQKDFVLLESSKHDEENYRTYLFRNPVTVIEINALDEVPEFFRKIETYLRQNYYLAGYFHYECGFHFEPISKINPVPNQPLAWLGVYRAPVVFNHRTGAFENLPPEYAGLSLDHERGGGDPGPNSFHLDHLRFSQTKREYQQKIALIQEYIRAGDTYQINFTGRYHFEFEGSIIGFYHFLKNKQNVPYGAFINANGGNILCFSPELFFRMQDDRIITRPMKGTAARGNTHADDLACADWLHRDPKNRAENLMIVDLLRNDLGRIAQYGSVNVTKIFEVEKYQTLFQMTSTIEARIQRDVGYYEIFKSLFPCGSITGAPKVRTMQIIHELENEPRGIYTGAIGFFSPNREAIFNVAIRTVEIREGKGVMGVGGGIVHDSKPEEEYSECRLKARFLVKPNPEFQLLETILWESGQYLFLPEHLNRLALSARYFDYPLETERLNIQLNDYILQFQSGMKYKIRLLLDSSGKITLENTSLSREAGPETPLVMISERKTDSSDIFLYHKTTNRELYNEMYQKAVQDGFADVIFRNEKGQITEGAVSNIIIKQGKRYFTPPIKCGLLPGVYRNLFLRTRPNVIEKPLYINDLKQAEAIYICNSVRGLRKVALIHNLW